MKFQAGLVTDLNSDSLILALEPEAASVWCKNLPSDGFISEEINNGTLEQTPGARNGCELWRYGDKRIKTIHHFYLFI